MASTRIAPVSSPDYGRIAELIDVNVGRALVSAAKLMVEDNTRKIREGRDIQGRTQKQNTAPVRRRKLKERGDSTPLVGDTRRLGSVHRWRINGISAESPRLSPSRTGKVIVNLHPDEEAKAGHVTELGYRVPFGFSRVLANRVSRMIERAVVEAEQRREVG